MAALNTVTRFKLARSLALQRDQAQSFVFNRRHHTLRDTLSDPIVFPQGISVKIMPNSPGARSEEQSLTFFADGSATSARIELSTANDTCSISVNAITGTAALEGCQ